MDYDVLIIGAGMSGLAAGIRLAQFEQRVLIVERHEVYGGLNSFYTLDGHAFDVGLHALTNFMPATARSAPMSKMLRQLRLDRERLELCPQHYSAICFPDLRMRFSNDFELLRGEVRDAFPEEIDGFDQLVAEIKAYDDLDLSAQPAWSRVVLGRHLGSELLTDALLCPLMYYGSATEDDMDWTQFVTMFKSIYLEGFARPRAGVRRIIAELVKRYRTCGGEFRMRCGVKQLEVTAGRVAEVHLDDGTTVRPRVVLSSAGLCETMRLCAGDQPPAQQAAPGRLSFIESISLLQKKPAELGLDATIIFFNDAPRFTYARPDGLIDAASGVICCPNNYEDHEHLPHGVVRLTSIANYQRWMQLGEPEYAQAKAAASSQAIERALRFIPDFRPHVFYRDVFSPRTIQRFTGHDAGAVYGVADKVRDGRTHLENLFLCGTDQGFLGIIGACLSGISMANLHVLAKT